MPASPLLAHYDVIIVGSGPSGIFTAYEIRKVQPQTKVLMIEKGHSIEKRKCPKRKTGTCINCQPCAITTGFSGGGSFSDGKLSINADGEMAVTWRSTSAWKSSARRWLTWTSCMLASVRICASTVKITALRSMPSAGPLHMPTKSNRFTRSSYGH